MKILLIRNDNIGDLICTTPAIEALRKKYPNAQIDIVVNSLNECVVKYNPFINKIHKYTKTKHEKKLLNKVIEFFKKGSVLFEIFRKKYDVAIIFRNSYSQSAAMFAKASRAKKIIGVPKNGFLNFVNSPITVKKDTHEIDFCFECLKPLKVYFNGEKTFYKLDYQDDKFKDYLFFHISSRIEQNKISEDKINKIIKLLKSKFEKILITSEDSIFADKVSQQNNVFYLKTSNINELARYLKSAKLLITLDGGVAHLGPALGVKTVAIFGKTNPVKWKPGGHFHNISQVVQDKSKIAQNINEEVLFNEVIKMNNLKEE